MDGLGVLRLAMLNFRLIPGNRRGLDRKSTMRIHRLLPACTLVLAASLLATPAIAHEGHHYNPGTEPEAMRGEIDNGPGWNRDQRDRYSDSYADDPRARDRWLTECRRRYSDNGLGGALIGGVAGGLLGNRIAGQGNRTVGTVAGAAIGAIAGAAIDKGEDRARTRDRCEAYLDDYYAQYDRGYAGGAPGRAEYGYPAMDYGYAVPMVMAPVMMPAQQKCTETVAYEYVDVPVRRRHIPRMSVRRAPDKRLPMK